MTSTTTMRIGTTWLDGMPVLDVQGEVDAQTAPELERSIERVSGRDRRIVIDLSDCAFIDSSVLHVLLQAAARDRLVIVCPPGNVRRVLDIVRVADVAPVVESLRTAVVPARPSAQN
jgi:anti-sigma B factor antagonist